MYRQHNSTNYLTFVFASFLWLAVAADAAAQSLEVKVLHKEVPASIRTISVVNDSVVWMAGSNGYVARSVDGGNTFETVAVIDNDSADYRTLYAFSEQGALVANTGSPAAIYLTQDGKVWNQVYENQHIDAFVDGIDFWDEQNGLVYGDPIDGRLLLVKTKDAGRTWEEMPETSRPLMIPGEASFAASGTAIRCFDSTEVIIATGGTVSRLLQSNNGGVDWTNVVTPVLQGSPSTGTFSFDRNENGLIIVVGGDYLADSAVTDHIFMTEDNGIGWTNPVRPTRGYRECVTYISNGTWIACGPTGMDYTTNNGVIWKPLSDEKGIHVIRKSHSGNAIYFAGKGIFGKIIPIAH